jgi:eukaryotic-like serine/threonine-protein kinase
MPPLTADRWRAISPYLDQALDLPTADRAGWLESICARDAGLAWDLQTLLAEQDRVRLSRFLERSVPLTSRIALTQSLAGQTIGAYRLVSLIGHGGMGSVWLAERCDGRFEGQVAVKLLNIALMGRAGEERFRREGTILARLTHPHIARLIDAGVTATGQPYLILEHVAGLTLDCYCDEHALGIEARVRLFLDVLDAVVHAHANLIVHGDLKPGNVLVSEDGGVKLLDFGIAKLLEPDAEWGAVAGKTSALTRGPGIALTPEYAAPEQVTGGAVTTATDVYALGVLLYVLLSGGHAVGDGGALDAIVAKAVKKNPAERYGSATALADDLRRFLLHEPISARPDTQA